MRLRRRFVWVAAILVVATLLVPAIAVAAPDSASVTHGTSSALSWTNVRDSYGVPLSDYKFVTSDPSAWRIGNTMLAFVLQLLFAVWWVVVTLAIWVIGYALSFGWLNLFAEVLLGTANLFAGQIATTMVLITAATLGAFIVAHFVIRGSYAKATMQVVTMIAVAVFSVSFLAHPLAEVLGPDGLLAKGRDLGISIAAGLMGNSNPDPGNLIATMQASLADNLVRKPLQVWNFGHVIDDRCGAAWSSGMAAGDTDAFMEALRTCDRAAYDAADQSSWSQLGAGLVLFVCGMVLVWFAIKLGMKVIRTAMNAVYHGFMSIFGFAAGGYIYGPTQTFLIRNLVDTAFAAFGMAAYTIFLAIYVLVLGDVFQQMPGQVMQVFVVSAVVMVIASRQLDNLRASVESGGQWVANRFAMATQSDGGAGGGGGPGVGDARTLRDWGPIPGLFAMNTVAGAIGNPLLAPYLWNKSGNPALWSHNWQRYHAGSREAALDAGQRAIERNTPQRPGAVRYGWALDNMLDRNIVPAHIDPALSDLGLKGQQLNGLRRAQAAVNATMSSVGSQFPPVWKAMAAWESVRNNPAESWVNERGLELKGIGAEQHAMFAAWSEVVAGNFIRHAPKLHATNTQPLDEEFIAKVKALWDSEDDLKAAISPADWNKANRATRHTLGEELAEEFYRRARDYNDDRTLANQQKVDEIYRRIRNVVSKDPDRVSDPWSP